jgi:hypothetical protein
MKEVWQVDVGYFCAGIITENEKVTVAAPILNWAIGKSVTSVETWIRNKKGKIVKSKMEE